MASSIDSGLGRDFEDVYDCAVTEAGLDCCESSSSCEDGDFLSEVAACLS